MPKLLALLLLLIQSAPPPNLPKAPDGYSWQKVPEIKGAFLRPDGWFFKREELKGTLAFFVTREDIEKTGEFQTGLSVNVFHLKKDPAVLRARDMIENLAAQHGGKVSHWEFGPFQEFSSQVTVRDATASTSMYSLTVANPKTNTLYLFTFESPEADWDSAWKTGKPIMDQLALDDEI